MVKKARESSYETMCSIPIPLGFTASRWKTERCNSVWPCDGMKKFKEVFASFYSLIVFLIIRTSQMSSSFRISTIEELFRKMWNQKWRPSWTKIPRAPVPLLPFLRKRGSETAAFRLTSVILVPIPRDRMLPRPKQQFTWKTRLAICVGWLMSYSNWTVRPAVDLEDESWLLD